jgi:nucleotide-binding universal stress UspA family protein
MTRLLHHCQTTTTSYVQSVAGIYSYYQHHHTGGQVAMIKDIVVHLSVGAKPNSAGDYAISVAAAFNARLTGIAFLYDPMVPFSAAAAEVAKAQERENQKATRAAIDRFTAACGRAGIGADPQRVSSSYTGVGEQFGRIARRFDLAIVGQAEPGTTAIEEIVVESTLFESGRPLIIVPYIQKGPLKLDRVMVCWDGSRPAARAIADAMPLLQRAGQVEVVIVTNERGKQDQIVGADMGAHLARHGLKVEVNRIPIGDVDVADMLLSNAADTEIDFIVMGGYGHSRLRQFLLGGVTRSMLRVMTAPVLMSH